MQDTALKPGKRHQKIQTEEQHKSKKDMTKWEFIRSEMKAKRVGYLMVAPFLVMFFVAMHSLLCILSVAFARINLKALGKVVRQTYAAEVIAGLLLLIFAFSYILRFVEPNLNSLGDALWYCFAIVTTIGFGDITASSLIGRVLSVTLGIYGIIVVALITSVIVNFYGEMKRENVKEEDEEEGEEGEEKEEKA